MAEKPYSRRWFTFGPRETDGIVLGLSLGSMVGVLASLFLMTRLLTAGTFGAIAGVTLVLGTVAAVLTPVADRRASNWIPITGGFLLRQALGWDVYRGGPARDPAQVAPGKTGRRPPRPPERMDLPGELAGFRLLSADTDHGPVGIIHDPRRNTYTAILSTAGTAMHLMSLADQDMLLASWGETLASLGNFGSGIVRIQLCDTTLPESAQGLQRRFAQQGGHGNAATAESYRQLLAQARPAAQRHQTLVSIQLEPRRARREVRGLGGGDAGACAYLVQRARRLADDLAAGGVTVEGMLSPRAVSVTIRSAYEPGVRPVLDAQEGLELPDRDGRDAAAAGPMAAHEGWSYYRTDDAFHALYWISEWPRKPVPGTFLSPMLLQTNCVRTLSVVMQPIDPRRAADEVARAETTKQASQTARAKMGFRTSARDVRESVTIQRQDEDLASGHALFRFLGVIRVTAPDLTSLDRACGEIELSAHALQLRRLYGEQASAFPATLPLCRGLRYGALR